jgi:hypothetical protein
MHARACMYGITPPRHGVGSVGPDDELKQAAVRRRARQVHALLVCSAWSTSRSTGTRAIRATRTLAWAGSRRGRSCQMIKRPDGR